MCIIAIKPKNKNLQEKSILQRCFNVNRDGSGYMYVNDKNEVVIKKGYMDFETYYKDLVEDYNKYNLKNKNLVMHFRIGTSGQSKLGCTHPFAITDDYDLLNATRVKTNIGVCHNGIVSMFNSRLAKYSDTQIYIASVLTPIYKLNRNAFSYTDVKKLVKDTTNSKWAFLDKFDNLNIVGDFEEDNGYLYSNSTYKAYTPTYRHFDGEDYFTSDYWLRKYNESKKKSTQETKETPKKDVNVNVKYVMLNKGNIFIGDTNEYFEVEKDNTFYYDKDYNIYHKQDDTYSLIDTNAVIYTDETFCNRRGFNY